jgi:8-oxo-dGTP diphosphatase
VLNLHVILQIQDQDTNMEKSRPFCYEYPRPALTVDGMIFSRMNDQAEILLIKRKQEPYKDCWAFPGGFVDMHETTDEAVVREIKEETGIIIETPEQFRTFSGVDRDPRGRTVSVVYCCFVDNVQIKGQAGDDAADMHWFSIDELPRLAFDHAEIIKLAREQFFSKK